MLLEDGNNGVEKRSSLAIDSAKRARIQKNKRELIPSRVGALQPSNLKPLPPVGHDPDEEPFQAVPDALETPSVMHNNTKQQQQQQQQQQQAQQQQQQLQQQQQ